MGAGVLIITHDLELALETADRVLVFYAGYTLEDAKTEDFRQEKTLRHPYTKALWRAMPQNEMCIRDRRGTVSEGCHCQSSCSGAGASDL